jgi:hypothetical protein
LESLFVYIGGDSMSEVRFRYYACEGFSVNTHEPLAFPSFGRCDARGIFLKATRLICCKPLLWSPRNLDVAGQIETEQQNHQDEDD